MNWERIVEELRFRTSRSSGAGGQHVNKTETRVEVIFDIPVSQGLTVEEKAQVMRKLATRIFDSGELVTVAAKSRSQLSNKEFAIDQLKAILEKALLPVKKRKKTRVPVESKEDRLQDKKKTAEKKEARKKPEV